jgi:hypothetical protein
MLNQKTVIYIILSAILLYLYYIRRDLAVFAAFVVVVAGTLIIGKDFNSIEGMERGDGDGDGGGDGGGDGDGGGGGSGGGSGGSGGGSGGGRSGSGGGCADMGFTAPKIKKDADGDLGESLEKEMKNIKKIADNHWPYDMKGDSSNKDEQESINKYVGVYLKIVKENKFSKDEDTTLNIFMEACKGLYEQVNSSDTKKLKKIKLNVSELPKGYLKEIVSVANKLHDDILTKVSESDELKGKGAKKIAKYLSCLCKHWITIFTQIDSMATGKTSNSSKKSDEDVSVEDE